MSRREQGVSICVDCGVAEALADFMNGAMGKTLTDGMARIAILNDRNDALRLPGTPWGVMGVMSQARDFQDLLDWQDWREKQKPSWATEDEDDDA